MRIGEDASRHYRGAQSASQELDEGVARAHAHAAAPRLPTKDGVAQDGNVEIERDPRPAARTCRRRVREAHAAGQPVDHDVQEASDARTDRRPEGEPKPVRQVEHEHARLCSRAACKTRRRGTTPTPLRRSLLVESAAENFSPCRISKMELIWPM